MHVRLQYLVVPAYNWLMRIHRGVLIVSIAFGISGCVGGGENANSRPAGPGNSGTSSVHVAKTNVEELTLLVNVPYETEDVVWKEDPVAKKVVAVMLFSPADADAIVAEAAKFGPPQQVSVAVETWYPNELIAQGEMSGDSALKGVSYPANSFFQPPYSTGRIARIEGLPYFVLEVSAGG